MGDARRAGARTRPALRPRTLGSNADAVTGVYPYEELVSFSGALLGALGVPSPWERAAANVFVETSAAGQEAHGLGQLPFAVKRIRAGGIDPHALGTIEKKGPAVAAMDGGGGLGQIVAARAMGEAIALARENGVGFVSVRNANHFGAAGTYARQATAAGLVGFAFSNSPSAIAPPGSRHPYLGTNPLAAGFPSGSVPIVVDIGMSVAARGKIRQAAADGADIPEGWAVGADGQITRDPHEALRGALLPMAGHKGHALALVVELLSAVLSGAGVGTHVPDHFAHSDRPANLGQAFLALDPARFGALDSFLTRVDALAGDIHALEPLMESDPPRLPGEASAERIARARAQGLRLPPALARTLEALGARSGIDFPRTLQEHSTGGRAFRKPHA